MIKVNMAEVRSDSPDETDLSELKLEQQASPISRRDFVAKSLTGVAAAAAGMLTRTDAEAREKASKAVAHYQNHPNKGEHCGACVHYLFPFGCSVVAGPISFHGWCRFYKPRG